MHFTICFRYVSRSTGRISVSDKRDDRTRVPLSAVTSLNRLRTGWRCFPLTDAGQRKELRPVDKFGGLVEPS